MYLLLKGDLSLSDIISIQNAAQCLSGQYPPKPDRVLPTYVVNLDAPPVERWQDLASKYKAEVRLLSF